MFMRSGSDCFFPRESIQGSRKAHASHSKEIDMISTFSYSILNMIFLSFDYVIILIDYFTAAYEILHEHDLADLFPIVFGLMLCFFGCHYLMLVTILETVRMLCWRELVTSIHTLHHNYQIAMESSRKDDFIDTNGNKIPNMQEISRQDLLFQKLSLFMKTVDVVEVRSAVRTLATAYFSMIAALRLKMARYLALALSSAHTIGKSIPLESILSEHLPPGSKKWSGILADTLLNVICMILAIFIGGWVGGLNCAIRGSHMFVQNMITLSQKKGLLMDNLNLSDPKSKVLMVVVAATGFLWQVSHSSGLPFPINIVLFPLTLLEWLLQIVVNRWIFLLPMMNFS
ncbi:unnamed protein product [Phytomonas sp. Hart1]|nr:unnamed protein product [Phytomonas sp. Hart1]|eukprot:CCW70314.1 unnamed protein product [Phytomonas sp. isolate Hart1]